MSTFNLSANIEHGFTEDTQYIVTPNAKRAIANIVNDFHSGIHSFTIIGTYGTGKSSFLLALENDLQNTRKKSRLLNPKTLSKTSDYDIVNIVGDYVDLATLLRKKLNLEGTSNNIIDELDTYYNECQKRDSFLIIVIDEFGKVLEHAAKNNPEKELYFLQKLAEYVNAPGHEIILLTTLHQNFGAYSRSLTEEQINEWIKVKGRFKEITFIEPIEQLLHLAALQLQNKNKNEITDNFIALYHLAQTTHFATDCFNKETAIQLSPLDAFSAHILTSAIMKYGQNERSLFTFLASKGKGAVYSFEPSKNTTYNLQLVFDYILYNFYSYLKDANSDSMKWSSIQVAIERVQSHDWVEDMDLLNAIRIVKALGLLNLFGNAGFHLSCDQLADYARLAMNIQNANEIIQNLEKKKIIRFAAYKERLVLFEGTDVDIESELSDAKMIIPRPTNYTEDLTIYFNKRISPVKAHFYQRGTPRFFDYKICDAPIEIVPQGDTDGYVELIFSSNKNTLEEIKNVSIKTDYAIVFAYFKNTKEIIDHLYNIFLYKYVKEKIVSDSDYVALNEIEKLQEYEEILLNSCLNDSLFSFNGNVTWIYKGEELTITSHRDFNKLLSNICNQIYCKTPTICNELFNKHKLSSSISGAKTKYFQALLDSSDKIELGFEEGRFPPEKTIYYSLLKNTGLHVDGEFTDAPSNKDIQTLWDACEEFLASTREKSRKLSELIKRLSAQPYKIKDGVLEFWLPTYLFIKRQDYSLYGENGQYIPNFNIELFDLMKKHIGEFKIKAYAVDGVKLLLFNQYRKFLNLGDNSSIKGGAFIETIKPFLFFYNRQLNEYAKHTKTLPHEESMKFREVLARAKDPEKAFLEDLPDALGYDDEKLKDANAVQDYCYVIQRAVRELRGCYNQLIDRIEGNLIESLGLESGEYVEYVKEIQMRLSKVKPHLLNPRQKEFYQHAMAQFDNRTEWYQSVCYSVLGSPLERMTDEQEPKLHDDLVFLFKECEQKAVLSESLNYKIDEKEEKRSQDLESKINGILTGDNNLDVYTLMRILQRKLNSKS